MQSELSQRNPELSGSEHWIGTCIAYQLDRIVDETDTSPVAPVGVYRIAYHLILQRSVYQNEPSEICF